MSQPEPADDHWGDSAVRTTVPATGRPSARFRKKNDRDGGPGDGDSAGRWSEGGGGFERVPPQDLDAEQSVLGGMLLSKDAIADVVEVLKGARLLPPGPRDDLRRRSSTCTPAASPPTPSPSPPS